MQVLQRPIKPEPFQNTSKTHENLTLLAQPFSSPKRNTQTEAPNPMTHYGQPF